MHTINQQLSVCVCDRAKGLALLHGCRGPHRPRRIDCSLVMLPVDQVLAQDAGVPVRRGTRTDPRDRFLGPETDATCPRS